MNKKMTAEKAIEQLNSLMNDRDNPVHCDDFDEVFLQDIEALKVGISALEKQVPKKVIWENARNGKIYDWAWACCPNCQTLICDEPFEECELCSNCGQALDWSDENE